MNKQKGIIIGVLALAVTMMVGYALFSETITINGTATAKGDFSLTTTCERGFSEKIKIESNTWSRDPEIGYENDSCSVSDNVVSFHTDLKFPGARRLFTIKVTNTGSIDAYLNMATGLKVVKNRICIDGKNGTLNETIEDSECYDDLGLESSNGLSGTDAIAFEKSDGTIYNLLDDAEIIARDFQDATGENIILEPGESMYFYAGASLNDRYGESSNNGGSFFITHDSSFEFKFTQNIK